jgi:carboxypeptidase family protein
MFNRRHILAIGAAMLLPVVCLKAQSPQPAPPAPESAPAAPESSNKKKPTGKHQHDFLIKGTVFTQEGLSFAGARIQIRKAGDKKFHWQDSVNSRGEFAIRVVQGAKYEVVVTGKGSKDQTKTVDATGNDRVEELVFHMEREGNKPS